MWVLGDIRGKSIKAMRPNSIKNIKITLGWTEILNTSSDRARVYTISRVHRTLVHRARVCSNIIYIQALQLNGPTVYTGPQESSDIKNELITSLQSQHKLHLNYIIICKEVTLLYITLCLCICKFIYVYT